MHGVPLPDHVQQPFVIQSGQIYTGWLDESSTRLRELPIKQKYSSSVCEDLLRLGQIGESLGLSGMSYLRTCHQEYQQKVSARDSPKYRAAGFLNLTYCFLKPELEESMRLMEEIGVKVIRKAVITHLHVRIVNS